MHPAMAVWIWSMAMARAWQGSAWASIELPKALGERGAMRTEPEQRFVRAGQYLHWEIAKDPLPDTLLDRLADLYWTERDADLAI